jgi:hypothetical protein
LKRERGEEGWGPPADAGIVLGQHLEGIELFGPRKRLGFGHGFTEPLPWNYRADRLERILTIFAGGDQRGADLSIEADLFVDRPSIGPKRAGMARLGLAEHRADQPIEKVDRLVREAGAQIERDRDQRGLTALAFIACDMLRRSASSFAGELG